ncbi:VRR-NUC domain-containing protein [Radiomyces spectabilis]|uniref:VRR-NUC domain-containing protein n=1 Tax=Radiomyces spectabilis TaxID=64574 RepID=UPI00221F1463|nr:VRR-NUC domain-containing protein [Radiomyces spectabilis]KAI8391174.1 VRR-NUC domain-containing protein [Radiomyces spectabilis]
MSSRKGGRKRPIPLTEKQNGQKTISNFFSKKQKCIADTPTSTAAAVDPDSPLMTENENEQPPITSSGVDPTASGDTATGEKPFFETSMYTDEMNLLLDTVMKDEQHLFTAAEIALCRRYQQLEDQSQHLLVRLLLRKQRWIRVDKLDYTSHVKDIKATIDDLWQQKFLLKQSSLHDIDEMLALLSLEELKNLAKKKRLLTGSEKRRIDFVQLLKQYASKSIPPIYNDKKADTNDKEDKDDKENKKTVSGSLAVILEVAGHCIRVEDDVYLLFRRLQLVYYRKTDLSDTNPMSAALLARLSRRNYPTYEYTRTIIWKKRDELLAYEAALQTRQVFDLKLESLQKRSAADTNAEEYERNILTECAALCENIIGLWEEQVEASRQDLFSENPRPYYLRRFEAGYIYTHLLEHGTKCLAKLREYELEALILRKLIDQKVYRLGKRGHWYNRLALVQMTHLRSKVDRQHKKDALQTCIEAIQDPRVHQIYLNGLYQRIKRVERDLRIPKREQHDFSYALLKQAEERTIYGERLSDSVTGKKSVWRDDDGAECSVEQLALSFYKKQGYQGFHCEGGVVCMLFVILFWDIIFASIPGVFETPYQTAPLDIASDTFYIDRIDMINQRLREIDEGRYLDIIREVDERERSRNTLCLGVRWDYELEPLLEIAECIGGAGLSALCRLLAEEFRRGGMPDLCCWNIEKKECIFSEVKGPGDKLSETQKLWIDTLSGMGIHVEVCHVKEWQGELQWVNTL